MAEKTRTHTEAKVPIPEIPSSHALNTERWDGRVNGGGTEQTFQDAAGEYSIEIMDTGVVTLWNIEGDGPATNTAYTHLKTPEGALRVMDVYARHPDAFSQQVTRTENGEYPSIHEVSFEEHLTTDHPMYHGRWENGTHSDIGAAVYQSEDAQYQLEWSEVREGGGYEQSHPYAISDERRYAVSLSRHEECAGEPGTWDTGEIAYAGVQNGAAVVYLMEAFMGDTASFDLFSG